MNLPVARAATDQAPDTTAWWRWASLVVVPAAMVLIASTRALRVEHVAVGLLFLALAQLGPGGRRFSWLALPLLLTGLLYDYFGLFLPFRAEVRVDELYLAEIALFGMTHGGEVITPPEWFASHHHPALDAVTGFAYMVYLFEVFLLAAYFYFRDRATMTRIAWSFLVVNLLGMAVWLAWPAAPPWYVTEYGLGPANLDALPSAAGAARFDALFGIDYFGAFYARNVNVFGAMPSLHVAYPTMVAVAVWDRGWAWRLGTVAFALLVAFSAVYLSHHYILDVIAGAVVGVLGCLAVVQATRVWNGGER